MSVEVEGVKLQGSVHRDKQPMALVHTAGSLAPGEPRFRNFVRYDKNKKTVVRRKYRLDQPHVHAIYRSKFWHVDRFNKLALGPKSIQYAVGTHDW